MGDRRSRFSILNLLSSVLGSHRDSRNTKPHSIDRIARRDKKRPPIRIPPVEVSRMAWNFKATEEIPFGIDDVNTSRPCAVDVPLGIHLHPVGIPRFVTASLIEQPSVA